MNKNLLFITLAFMLIFSQARGQRVYKANSELASGSWYKISIKEQGIYRVDVAFLSSLGINTANLQSNTIRLWGNGGQMLSENNSKIPADDLVENAIEMFDGGDGTFSGNDYFLFYANGPQTWEKDSINKKFIHRKNIYSDQSFYFINIGSNGKRIANQSSSPLPNTVVNSFNERYFYELDSVNFLQSGKEWYGEEFANAPGKVLTKTFSVSFPNISNAEPALIISDVVSRSNNVSSRFVVSVNNAQLISQNIAPVGVGVYDIVANTSRASAQFTSSSSSVSINYQYQPGNTSAQGWLNWFEIFCRRNLSFSGSDILLFRDWNSVASGNIAEYRIQNTTSSAEVWDVTNPLNPVKMITQTSGSELRFNAPASALREYVAFSGNNLLRPVAVGTVANQNLHNSTVKDLIIVTHSSFLNDANQLATLHQQKDGLRTIVATVEQIYNEFSSGSQDPSAIRDFVKMYFDKANGDVTKQPKYLLLFGDGSYDYKNRTAGNANFVPVYESVSSLDPLSTYTSDDFFGLLNDNDDVNATFPISLIDIGIGRIPVKNSEGAKNFLNKIIQYTSKESFGPWRNDITFVADDEDFNLHFQDAEQMSSTVKTATSDLLNNEKIYLDAFKQVSGSGGSRYPAANEAVNSKMFSGNLIWNYSGHGGYRRLAEEVILDQESVNVWNNANKLPLLITATCDFAPFDNPSLNSIGENILIREKTGAIALMTTTRVVFAFSNRIMNNNYLQFATSALSNGKYRTLGDAVKDAKNFTYTNFSDFINNRKFTLLGDPALTLGFPQLRVKTNSINGNTNGIDTLKALNKYTINGSITDVNGNVQTNFNGTAYPTILDKPETNYTLANDGGSYVAPFTTQNNILYRGKVKVTNGNFSYTFIVPKDINYQFGNGKISYYANNETIDGNGADKKIVIGGAGNNVISDNEGPVIKAFLNDEKFINGGITNQNPVLILKLSDSSGINTAGTGIGHDIIATLDNNNNVYYVLNDYYESELDSYQKGTIRFQIPKLEEGVHSIKIKAWDILNNSTEIVLEFKVVKDTELELNHVLNYPNPFTTKTTFWFEHNKPGENLQVTIRIYTITAKVVKTIKSTINNTGNRSCEIDWDGRDDYGDKVGRGVYIYEIEVKSSNGKTKRKLEKLVLL